MQVFLYFVLATAFMRHSRWVATAQTSPLIDLVFIVDGSGSINDDDWELQKRGIITAIKNKDFIPRDGSIALAVVQFSEVTRIELPYTIIQSISDILTTENAINSMVKLGFSTNPGDGIVAATEILRTKFRASANQTYCMTTDGIRNDGVLPKDAIDAAKASNFRLDRFSVVAIDDGVSANETVFKAEYGNLVFGGGTVFVAKNFAEFANTVGANCLSSSATNELVGLEVTQVSQDLTNSVPLLQNKATLVRAYIQPVDPSNVFVLQVRVRGRRGGVELPGSPLAVKFPGNIISRPKALERRQKLGDSLNFLLPESWRSGTIELEVEGVGTILKCLEKAGPIPNDCKITVTFQNAPTLQVKFVRLRYETSKGKILEASTSDLSELENRLLAIFPVSQIDRATGYLDMGKMDALDGTEVNSRLEAMRVLDKCISSSGCNRRYYGAIDQGGELLYGNNSVLGLAHGAPGTASCGIISDGNAYGRNTHAHEIAHSLGVDHAVTNSTSNGLYIGVCGEEASIKTPTFPFFESLAGKKRATIGPLSQGADKIVFGWDSYFNQIIDPTKTFELMSYCGSTFSWVSTFTNSLISNYITLNFRRLQLNSQKRRKLQNSSYTVIRAIVNMDTNTTTFLPTIQVALPSIPSAGNNDYQIVCLNSSGGEVIRVAFDPFTSGPNIVPSGNTSIKVNSFYVQAFVTTPPPGSIATIRLVQNRTFLGSAKSISGNKPTVRVLFPNGGERLNGSAANISWSATDPDGDALSYSVLFSPDGGSTWKTITTDYTTASMVVPLNSLGQTRFGLIRVQASDGFNIGEDVSDATFITPNIPPEVQIIRPFNGDNFAGVELVIFQASTFDVEDGTLAGNRLNWTSNIDGFLGSGLTVEILASSLSENNHTITLIGSDSGGATTMASVTITVYRIAPPIEDPITAAPTNSPIAAPVKAPTNAPIKGPTESPVQECRIGLFNLLCGVRSLFQRLLDFIFRRG